MKKKIKLSFDELENQFPTIISADELKSILGGYYGYTPDSWSTDQGFVDNVNSMISQGMFNFSDGGNSFTDEFSLSQFYSDSDGGSGSSPMGMGSGSGSSSWSMPNLVGNRGTGSSSWNFGGGQFTLSPSTTSGSTVHPGQLSFSGSGFTVSSAAPGVLQPYIKIEKDGKTLQFGRTGGTHDGKFTITFGTSF